MEPKFGIEIVSLSGGTGKTERAVIEHVALPHLKPPLTKGRKISSRFPSFVRRGEGEVETEFLRYE